MSPTVPKISIQRSPLFQQLSFSRCSEFTAGPTCQNISIFLFEYSLFFPQSVVSRRRRSRSIPRRDPEDRRKLLPAVLSEATYSPNSVPFHATTPDPGSVACSVVAIELLDQSISLVRDRRGSIRISWRLARMRVYHTTVAISERRSVARVSGLRGQAVRFVHAGTRTVRCWGVYHAPARQISVNPFERVLTVLFCFYMCFALTALFTPR
jgi:hypothetical protein